jgi:hypothetical protein
VELYPWATSLALVLAWDAQTASAFSNLLPFPQPFGCLISWRAVHLLPVKLTVVSRTTYASSGRTSCFYLALIFA